MNIVLIWNRNYALSLIYIKRCDAVMKNIQMSLLRWSPTSTSLCCHPRGKAPCCPITIDRKSYNCTKETFSRFLVCRVLLDICICRKKSQFKRISFPNVHIAHPSCLQGAWKLFFENLFCPCVKILYPHVPIVKYTTNILLFKGICDNVQIQKVIKINHCPLVNVFKLQFK